MDDQFGHWLAGFIDGEACFFISCNTVGASYYCGMKIALRDDDAEVLEMIHATLGLGNVRRSDWHHRRRITNRPTVVWEVGSHADCMALVAILDEFPLRTKKARDYAVWRQAVEAVREAREPLGGRRGQFGGRATKDWTRLAALKDELAAARAYR